MAAAKSQSASTSNGGAIKKSKSSTSSTNGTTTPVPPSTQDGSEHSSLVTYGPGRPDKKIYDSEQERIKKEIDAVQVKLNAVKDKINLAGRGGAGNEKRNALRAELDSIRNQQSFNKTARGKVFDQLKSLQDGIQKKVKDLNTARGRIPYKTVEEVDNRINQLEKQVESGNLKLVDEKRALQEISQCRRNRKVVEGFQAEQESIEADRAAADELRKQLDDPEAKAISDRYEAIQAELAIIKKEGDEAYNNRSKLFDERSALQAQVDELWSQKKESAQRYREANDRHWTKVNEDRARRAERDRAQKAAEEEAKKKEIAEQLLEDASIPAFQVQIEDCQTLIDYFSGKTTSHAALSTTIEKAEVVGVPKLEIRKVEAPSDVVVRKKKGEEEESYFVGGGKGKKGKKGGKHTPTAESPTVPEPTSANLHVPLATLSALLTLSIPPPTSSNDVPRLVEDLKIKKAWFEANQARVTAENKEKALAEIRRLTGGKSEKVERASPTTEITPPNGGAEQPAEPAPAPVASGIPETAVPEEVVVEKLEQEVESEA
ncbi:hypothetical protein C8Q75DRAFT_845999 [Abortiporus biennis]|nr:hypothetical protein C8Q75DRAFT_845999 [Abortiporus biennis]